jgi:hypothetical protein
LVNPISDRILVFMTFPDGTEYPLGKYMFTDASSQIFTSGDLNNVVLNDEMYMVDQPITQGFSAHGGSASASSGLTGLPNGVQVAIAISQLLEDLPVVVEVEGGPGSVFQSWGIGTNRGSILESLALSGGYFSPWFGNDTKLHFIQSFNPALEIPDFDWDAGNQVMRSSIVQTSNILNAPNRFIVISNTPTDSSTTSAFAQVDVPVNAPNSFEKRGFIIASVSDVQATNSFQCGLIAENLMQRSTVFETVTMSTAPDPRHDSYNVIKWQGDLWLELTWTLALTEGAPMTHTLRKAYS